MIGGHGRHVLQARHPVQDAARSGTGAAASARTPPSSNRPAWTRSGWTPRCGRCRGRDAALRVSVTASLSSPRPCAASAASWADRPRMPQGERAFEVDEVAERHQQRVQRRPVQPRVRGRAPAAAPSPTRLPSPGTASMRFGVADEGVDHRGVELPASPAARHRHRALDAVLALMHLDHVGQLGDAHLDRDRVARRTGGQSAAVEAFERVTQRRLHIGGQPDPLGQQRRRRAVRVDELRDSWPRALTIQRRHRLQPLQQRLAAARCWSAGSADTAARTSRRGRSRGGRRCRRRTTARTRASRRDSRST